MAHPVRTLRIEPLEAREVPAASPAESFDAAVRPALPAGWAHWSSDGTTAFTTAAGQGMGGTAALVSSGTSRTTGFAWSAIRVPGDTGAAVSVRADSLAPTFVFARGAALADGKPSYLAAVVTRGLKVELWEVAGGTRTVLASVASPPSAYLSGQWVRVSLVPTGGTAAVRVVRADTGQYLNGNGTWQAGETDVLTATTALPPAEGFVGVGRSAAFSGDVRFDDFAVLAGPDVPAPPPPPPTPTPGVAESFEGLAAGAAPAGWQTWAGGAAGTIGATTARFLGGAAGFASSGGSTTTNRAWSATDFGPDADASAAVYLDSLTPARVFVRGAGLDTTAPTYYAASITRGLEVKLVRVVNGTETVLGSVKSGAYFSSQWARVRVVAEGDRLRASVYRTDTRQWLTAAGGWSGTPDFALEVRDAAITAGGKAGVARAAAVSGTVTFDDFEAKPAGVSSGPAVAVAPVNPTTGPLSGEVTFRATATGNPTRVEFRLNNEVRAAADGGTATWTLDTTTLTNGNYTLNVRAFDAAGNIGSADYAFAVSNANADPLPKPTIPRHYTHIRVAALAYSGNPMGTVEQNLLKNSIDLVVPNTRYLSAIQAASPDTPQLIYSNVSNLYQGLLTDWLAYADRTKASRELAFYHVTKATPFTGNSPSSQPVTWFWGAYQTAGGTTADVTSASRGGAPRNLTLGAAGTTTAFGYTDRFRELNVNLVRGAAAGWSGVWEYASAADAAGNPTAWKALAGAKDGTNGFTQTGTVTFDPPTDWTTATATTGGNRLFYVRFRVTAGTAAAGPEVRTVLGRDYVGANGSDAGTIPAFDATADRDGDGYLNDAEYAARTAGKDARFTYESRLFYPYYGQMRFVTNPSAAEVRRWAGDYHVRILAENPLADGIFMDNATGRLAFSGVSVAEPTGTFGTDSGALMAAVSRAIAPRWVLANTAGGGADATPIAGGSAASFEEFLIRPLQANWSEVGDAAALIQSRLNAAGSPSVVVDSHPAGGSPTDPRTQVATLAYYYLVADPERTFLMFYGGSNPSSTWSEHWSPAAAVDVGTPAAAMRVFATGADPENAALAYRVLARDYGKALVLYKPLSYATGKPEGTTSDATATVHQLGGSYRPVRADGTLGAAVTSITLRNGEGAVLVKA